VPTRSERTPYRSREHAEWHHSIQGSYPKEPRGLRRVLWLRKSSKNWRRRSALEVDPVEESWGYDDRTNCLMCNDRIIGLLGIFTLEFNYCAHMLRWFTRPEFCVWCVHNWFCSPGCSSSRYFFKSFFLYRLANLEPFVWCFWTEAYYLIYLVNVSTNSHDPQFMYKFLKISWLTHNLEKKPSSLSCNDRGESLIHYHGN